MDLTWTASMVAGRHRLLDSDSAMFWLGRASPRGSGRQRQVERGQARPRGRHRVVLRVSDSDQGRPRCRGAPRN